MEKKTKKLKTRTNNNAGFSFQAPSCDESYQYLMRKSLTMTPNIM
jgi:hypothetical protein